MNSGGEVTMWQLEYFGNIKYSEDFRPILGWALVYRGALIGYSIVGTPSLLLVLDYSGELIEIISWATCNPRVEILF